jgi:hypothetical protein
MSKGTGAGALIICCDTSNCSVRRTPSRIGNEHELLHGIVGWKKRWDNKWYETMIIVNQTRINQSAVNDSTSYIDSRWSSISVSSPQGARIKTAIMRSQAPGQETAMHPSIPMQVEDKQSSCQSPKAENQKSKVVKVLLARFFF